MAAKTDYLILLTVKPAKNRLTSASLFPRQNNNARFPLPDHLTEMVLKKFKPALPSGDRDLFSFLARQFDCLGIGPLDHLRRFSFLQDKKTCHLGGCGLID